MSLAILPSNALCALTWQYLLIFDYPPGLLHEGVVLAALAARPADFDFAFLQPPDEIAGSELATLIDTEDL